MGGVMTNVGTKNYRKAKKGVKKGTSEKTKGMFTVVCVCASDVKTSHPSRTAHCEDKATSL